jgi:ATP-dependent protease ClpP protease subunit
MKKLILILMIVGVLALSGGIRGHCGDVKKTMEILNHEMTFSETCRIYNNEAYMVISNIHSYSAQKLWKDLKLINAMDIKRINVFLNSPGGDASDGFAMADMLRNFRENNPETEIIMEGLGNIMSAAVLIFLQGTYRVCTHSTTFLIHPASVWKWQQQVIQQDEEKMEKDIEKAKARLGHMKKIKEIYMGMVTSRTKLTNDELEKMIQKDTYFWSDDALKWGFAHAVK